MPERLLVAKALGTFLGVLAHPHRIRIIEELREGERDVASLQEVLGISHSGVSQHLMLLRTHRIVTERREGRHVYYRLRDPELARWLLEGVRFLEIPREEITMMQQAIETVRREWGNG